MNTVLYLTIISIISLQTYQTAFPMTFRDSAKDLFEKIGKAAAQKNFQLHENPEKNEVFSGKIQNDQTTAVTLKY